MRVKIGPQVYDAAALDRVSLGDIIKLESETAALGKPMKWSGIREMAKRVQDLPAEALAEDDDLPWFLALLVWASRLNAGEKISFGDAIDFPWGDLEFLPEPQDFKQAADPQKARPGSGRAAKRQAGKAAKKTSARASTTASS